MASQSNRNVPAQTSRRATNISLSAALVTEAKQRGINVSRACEEGLARAVKDDREAKSVEEHRDYFNFWNDWVEKNGLPLAEHRHF